MHDRCRQKTKPARTTPQCVIQFVAAEMRWHRQRVRNDFDEAIPEFTRTDARCLCVPGTLSCLTLLCCPGHRR
jgi:hypothetical protein